MVHHLVRRGSALLTVLAMLGGALPVFAETNFVTDGTKLLSPNSVFDADTSWRIDTSDVGHATIESIEPDFVGPTDDGASTEGWTVSYEDDEGGTDDGFLGVPLGFETTFNGDGYDRVYIGSNTYFTFGRGSYQYSELAFDYPDIPGVHACSDDHSYQRVMYMPGEGQTRVRYEGSDSTSGELDAPTVVYEAIFYDGESYVDLHIGRNDGCFGDTLNPEIRGVKRTGFTLTASSGTWRTENALEFTYQWQRLEGEEWIDIDGEVADQHEITVDDEGFQLRVAVTGDDGETVETKNSSSTITIEAPVEITTCEELMGIDGYSSDGVFVLQNNIDCSLTEASPINFEGGFNGVFEGQGYEISNLSIVSVGDNVGLFYQLDPGARVQNFTATGWEIDGSAYVGFIAGQIASFEGGDVRITDVTISDSTLNSGDYYAGGLTGYWSVDSNYDSSSRVERVVFDGITITGGWDYIGGMIGYLDLSAGELAIEDSSFDGTVTMPADNQGLGGVIGYASNYGWLNMRRVAATGTIGNGNGNDAGGLIGYLTVNPDELDADQGTFIEDSYVNADISNQDTAGGLVGQTWLQTNTGIGNLQIERSYAAGSITSANYLGGILGYVDTYNSPNDASISSSFSDMTLIPGELANYGGGVGSTDGGEGASAVSASDFYFNIGNAGTTSCDVAEWMVGCTGVNGEGEDPNYFLDITNAPMSSWDFASVWLEVFEDYPELRPGIVPTVTTDPDSTHSKTTATVSGSLDNNDGGAITEYGFEYGETIAYGDVVSETSEGAALGTYSQVISSLRCNTTYHFRAFAVNDDGTGYGEDETVDTSSCGGGGGAYTPYSPPSDDSTDTTTDDSSDEPADETETEEPTDDDNVTPDATYTYDEETDRNVAEDSGTSGPSPFDSGEEAISVVAPGWFIRGEHYSTVYFVTEDGGRHAFWDTTTFFTWADSWDEVIWVTDATLATLPLESPMLPQPGVVLVKIVSDPTVYAISADTAGNPVLHAIPDEATATALYGADWADYVLDIDPTIMHWFGTGAAMTTSSTVDLSIMKTRDEIAAQIAG